MEKLPEKGSRAQNEKEPSTRERLERNIIEVVSGDAAEKIVNAALEELAGYINAIDLERGFLEKDKNISETLKKQSEEAENVLMEIEGAIVELQKKLKVPSKTQITWSNK